MEHIVNQIILTGNLAGAPRYSHENHGRRFYAFPLEVERLSGTTDTLPVLAPLELLEQTPAAGGDTLCVTGQIRSYNNREPEGRRLVISVLAETMTLCSAAHDNRAELLGTICRAPVYRRTPLGREICDVMLAVNRPYRRADYLPCILWGRTAQEAENGLCSVIDRTEPILIGFLTASVGLTLLSVMLPLLGILSAI